MERWGLYHKGPTRLWPCCDKVQSSMGALQKSQLGPTATDT